MLKVLITNDDGVSAAGIVALANCLAAHAQVVVVAPEKPSSARSHCITLHKPLRLNEVPAYRDNGGAGSLAVFSCSGTPVDCVVIGLDHVCREHKPDLVLSGINDGYNIAEDLIYSGTVGGAMEGAINGIPAFSISQGRFEGMDFDASAALIDMLMSVIVYGRTYSWHAVLKQNLLEGIDTSTPDTLDLAGIPADMESNHYPAPGDWAPADLTGTACINLNLPKIPVSKITGMCWTRSGSRDYVDVVQQREDPFGRKYFWIAGERVLMDELPGTDTWALSRGLVSATPMQFDLTSHADLAPFISRNANRIGNHES